jgi:hypothetical protein
MEDIENESLDDKRKHKRMNESKRHRNVKETDEYSKESFKKMKEEIDELKRNELNRARELEELKQKIRSRDDVKANSQTEPEYALGFDKNEYLKKGFIESAHWIKNVLTKTMKEEMEKEEFKQKFESLSIAKKYSTHIGMRSCARFNRSEECNLGRFHSTHSERKVDALWTSKHQHWKEPSRQQQQPHQLQHQQQHQSKRNEMRLHVCTLCLETFGAAFGHSVLNCPWILKKNWSS